MARQTAMDLLGHKTRCILDRSCHIIGDADRVETLQKLAALHGAAVPELREVVAFGDVLTERTRRVPAQSPRSEGGPRVQCVANGGVVLASPTIAKSNRAVSWVRGTDDLRGAIGTAA